jgi:nicotinate-nucleotide adenylyltransferase
MNRRVGIYSGTFDPLHQGHIDFALAAIKECGLDHVVLLPEPKPRGKNAVTPIHDRLQHIESTIETIPSLSVVKPFSEQFTVRDTLPKLKELFAGDALTLLVGSDVVQTFSYRWDDLDLLLHDMSLAIGMRDGITTSQIKNSIKNLETTYAIPIKYTLIRTSNSHLASSKIKKTS